MHSSDLKACGKKCCYFWFHYKLKTFDIFLVHLSQKLKWAIVKACCPLSDYCQPSGVNCSHFQLFNISSETLDGFWWNSAPKKVQKSYFIMKYPSNSPGNQYLYNLNGIISRACIKNMETLSLSQWLQKDLGRFIIQICPTYNDKRCSRHMLIKINIYCQYIILTIWKHDNFCWRTTTFIEKNW